MTYGLLKQHLALAQQYHVHSSLFAPVCKHYEATFFTECRTFSYLFLLSLLLLYITINEQIQNIAQKKDTLCRRMYN